MKPRVLLDVDGVLCAFLPGVLKLVHEHTGRYHTAEDVKRFDFASELGLSSVQSQAVKSSISRRPNWWRTLEPCPGAREGLDALRKVADVWIVTSPWWSCETWLGERCEWLDRHMGVPASRIVMTGAKHLVAGDFLVDDKTSTLREWAGEHPMGTPIQWVTPHNRLDGWTGIATCDWSELVACVSQTADSPAPPAAAASAGPAGGETGTYSHSVIDVCMRLHGCDRGTGDGIPNEERAELIRWLRGRVRRWAPNKAWPSCKVDDAVNALAIAVLDQADVEGHKP